MCVSRKHETDTSAQVREATRAGDSANAERAQSVAGGALESPGWISAEWGGACARGAPVQPVAGAARAIERRTVLGSAAGDCELHRAVTPAAMEPCG